VALAARIAQQRKLRALLRAEFDPVSMRRSRSGCAMCSRVPRPPHR